MSSLLQRREFFFFWTKH